MRSIISEADLAEDLDSSLMYTVIHFTSLHISSLCLHVTERLFRCWTSCSPVCTLPSLYPNFPALPSLRPVTRELGHDFSHVPSTLSLFYPGGAVHSFPPSLSLFLSLSLSQKILPPFVIGPLILHPCPVLGYTPDLLAVVVRHGVPR